MHDIEAEPGPEAVAGEPSSPAESDLPAADERPLADTQPPADARPPAEPPATGPASIVDGREHAVDARSIVVARITAMGWTAGLGLIPGFVFTLVWLFGPMLTFYYVPVISIWALLYCCALGIGYKWPALHYKYLRYRVDRAGLTIRRGVLWRKVIDIPTSRVQHTDVEQGPLQRQYDIATLTVHTAGTQGASISLGGLERNIARRLRDHLLPEHRADGA